MAAPYGRRPGVLPPGQGVGVRPQAVRRDAQAGARPRRGRPADATVPRRPPHVDHERGCCGHTSGGAHGECGALRLLHDAASTSTSPGRRSVTRRSGSSGACSREWVPNRGTKTTPRQGADRGKRRLAGAFDYRAGRTRTCNPRFWRPVLCQLSYCPRQRHCIPARSLDSPSWPPRAGARWALSSRC